VGAVQNPIIPTLRHHEVAAISEAVGTDLFITAGTWRGFRHAAMGADLGLEVLSVDLETPPGPRLRLPTREGVALPPPPEEAEACRWLYFTSGTTGRPKGARHRDASVIASSLGMVEHLGFADGDVYPIAFPIAHVGGMTMLTAALRGGGRLVLFDRFDPASTPVAMAAHRPTILGSAQPFFRAYLDAQSRHGGEPLYPALRTCTAGGAPTPEVLLGELVEVFGIPGVVNSWGLTEFPVATCPSPSDPADVLATTVGRPCPGVSVRVVDGELRLRGPQCCAGYVDAAEDRGAFDDEGWFRTGDMGELDADGNVRVTGRCKDIIICNAENISTSELEAVIGRHPDIDEVAVIGLPDPRTGERVCAVVVATPGLTLAGLVAHCRDQGLAPHKCPERLEALDALPKNPMGKVKKDELKKRFG
jgi:acyl-CoA synthetase (AMP-forming)/AMP-acid ligase II